jgi:hypothetical protein
MARSTYVYVIQEVDRSPISAFTVKHELISHIKRDLYQGLGWTILRFKDGVKEFPTVFSVEEICK